MKKKKISQHGPSYKIYFCSCLSKCTEQYGIHNNIQILSLEPRLVSKYDPSCSKPLLYRSVSSVIQLYLYQSLTVTLAHGVFFDVYCTLSEQINLLISLSDVIIPVNVNLFIIFLCRVLKFGAIECLNS